jgi:hypothetical protein
VTPRPSGFSATRISGLQPVGVLVLVDEDVIERRPDRPGRRRIGHQLGPVEQQIVVVEHLRRLLGLDVGGKQCLQLGRPAETPGVGALEDTLDGLAGVHRPRVDREAGALGGEPALGAGVAEPMPHEVDQVLGVAPVVQGEGRIETDRRGVGA